MHAKPVAVTVSFKVTLDPAAADWFDGELRLALTPDVPLANAMLERAGIAAAVQKVEEIESRCLLSRAPVRSVVGLTVASQSQDWLAFFNAAAPSIA